MKGPGPTPQVSDRRLFFLVGAVFFLSGFPALIYQLVWQRSLFTIYGINVESVTVVVAAFMLGLGLGSLAGGAVSRSKRAPLLLVFGAIEIAIGTFGIFSLHTFAAVGAHTLTLSGAETAVVTFLLVLVPTCLMGATLPILVAALVRRSGNVGKSVGILYFVNTLGSAVACWVGALWIFRTLGQSGAVGLAAALNFTTGLVALAGYWLLERRAEAPPGEPARPGSADKPGMHFGLALVLCGLCGFISLSYEILWFRMVSFATASRAASFAMLLGTFLAGIAIGALVARRFCPDTPHSGKGLRVLSLFMVGSSLLGFGVAPGVAHAVGVVGVPATLVLVLLAAALLGAAFPLISHQGVKPTGRAGAAVSYLYLANIVGATSGSLVTGFLFMDVWPLESINLLLCLLGLSIGMVLLLMSLPGLRQRIAALLVFAAVATSVGLSSGPLHHMYWERLQHKRDFDPAVSFRRVIENKSGVISVDGQGRVFGDGAYDGAFNTGLFPDTNGIVRAYSVSAWHPGPKEVLLIGLGSGSWAQVLVHHPMLEKLTIVEINPGYLEAIPDEPAVSSLLSNPKIEIIIDDGRRWLNRNPEKAFDLVVMNTSFHWRSNITNLLSVEFLELVRRHLKPGGALFYNTTFADRVLRTAVTVYPCAWRVLSFIAVSDSPMELDRERLGSVLRGYTIDSKPVFDLENPEHRGELDRILGLELESHASLQARTSGAVLVTDDNMGTEWFPLREGEVNVSR